MSYDDDENSIQDGQPRELYDFLVNGTTHYRIAGGDRDVVFGGQTFGKYQVQRDVITIGDPGASGAQTQLSIAMPVQHPLPQRYLALGTPPTEVSLTLYCLQQRSGEAIIVWRGDVISMSYDNGLATFLVPTRSRQVFLRTVSTWIADRVCVVPLYSTACGVNRDAYKITTTVLSVDGREVKVDLGFDMPIDPSSGPWVSGGDVLHVASGERMDVGASTKLGPPSTVVILELAAPIVGMKVGDVVEVSPGCDHFVDTCDVKFNNLPNFRGLPMLPVFNPMVHEGLGVIAQQT